MRGRIVEAVAEKAGLGELLSIAEEVYNRLRSSKMLFIDEFHLASKDPIGDLEALAKLVSSYSDYRELRLIITSSEGWVMTGQLVARLGGYSATIYLVEPMNEEDMEALYTEYRERYDCLHDWPVFSRLVGGLPGYLEELCRLDKEALLNWINQRIDLFATAILSTGYRLDKAIKTVYKLLVEGVKASDKVMLDVGYALTRYSIAYPRGLLFKP